MLGAVTRAQHVFEEACEGAGFTLNLLLRTITRTPLIRRKKDQFGEMLALCTLGSMTVVLIIALFTGMIVALQTGNQLRDFGQQNLLGYIIAVGMCREMGPVFTALALAGLVGSTYAAQLGTMKVSEEIDALEAMSIDPVYFLVMPRIIALAAASVVLTVYADIIGIAGGMLVAKAHFGVGTDMFMKNAQDALKLRDIFGGLLKAFVFGTTIATVACSQGLRARHGAAGVGFATLRAVVVGFIFILVFDYFLSWMLY
jgi:phospholipid/cholesterol/gamma-HCH transport system permease protein